MYTGTIVLESLYDKGSIEIFDVIATVVTDDEKEEDRWHIVHCRGTRDQVMSIQDYLLDRWYCHFWNEKEMIVVFRKKSFIFARNDTKAIEDVVSYGMSLGIPEEQLDFLIA